MYKKLTGQVWWGDWQAPFETKGQVGAIINVAHAFSKRRGRNIYWQRLEEISHNTIYFRIARRDREDVDDLYADALAGAIDVCRGYGKMPILTHCQMGGHRGPSSALFTAWHLAGRTGFEALHQQLLALHPRLATRGVNYYKTIVAYCRAHDQRST